MEGEQKAGGGKEGESRRERYEVEERKREK